MTANPVTKKTTPKVDLDATREKLARLGLVHATDHLAETLGDAVKDSWPPHRFLDQLLDHELQVREERRLKTALRLSGLPTGQTLGNFDFAFQPSVERSRIETLATCSWIREKESLLMQGPPGVGKTHLAIALGVRAVENGFSVAFHRLEDLLAALKRDADVSPQRLRRRKRMNVALLIIDEVGCAPRGADRPRGLRDPPTLVTASL
jgi:DNA replication protein DnaC